MNRLFYLRLILCVAMTGLLGCGQSWQLDYSKPAADFNEDAVLAKAKPYIGELITVKGVVTRQDLSDSDNNKIYLGHSICCNLGKFQTMAETYKVGDTVFITGFLKRCDEEGILLEPAIGRDPKAEFNPIQ